MDNESEIIKLLQTVAAMEVKVSTCVDNLNGFGKSIRSELQKSEEDIAKLEHLILKAQLYILACVSVMGVVAGIVGFIISAYGIRLEDIFLVSKK